MPLSVPFPSEIAGNASEDALRARLKIYHLSGRKGPNRPNRRSSSVAGDRFWALVRVFGAKIVIECRGSNQNLEGDNLTIQRSKKWLVRGLVKFATAVARLVCLDLLG